MENRHHPFWKREYSFKYLYGFGLATMSMGHMKAITETKEYFESFLRAIRLTEEDGANLFLDINNHFEERIDEVFSLFRSKEEQYCFVLDLYSVMDLTSWAREYCQNVLEDYLQVFQLSSPERRFFEEFNRCRCKGDVRGAREALHMFEMEGYDIRYDFLTWFYPEFSCKEEYGDLLVAAGATVRLDKPAIIKGNILVEKGGSLLLHGTELEMWGKILVKGGRLQVDHAVVQIFSCSSDYWLDVREASVVSIIDTRIDCKFHCGAIRQMMGQLIIEDSFFQNTDKGRGVAFSGAALHMVRSTCTSCRQGAVSITGSAGADIAHCSFLETQAEYGGAVYSDTIRDVTVLECDFTHCKARYLGATVYFRQQKLGQSVADCQWAFCEPRDSVFFNCM